jgi:hypothetical protein
MIQLTEGPFDMQALSALVFTSGSELGKVNRDKLTNIYLRLMNAGSDLHEVVYALPKSGFGNLRAQGPSIQGLPNSLRRLITTGLSDLDIVSSGMSIMSHIFDRQGLDCTQLKEYLSNRESVLSTINEDRRVAKRMIETLFNGGSRPAKNDDERDDMAPLISEFSDLREMFYTRAVLSFTDTYGGCPEYKKIIATIDPTKIRSKQAASFVARIKDYHQARILACMVDFIGHDRVSTLISDGIHVRGDVVLADIEAHVFDTLQFKIVLKSKPFNMTNAEKLVKLPKQNDTGIDWGTIPCVNHTIDDMPQYVDRHGETKRSLHPIQFNDGVRCMLFNVHMGGGKTFRVREYIRTLRQELQREVSVLILTARCLQAKDIVSLFGDDLPLLLHYKQSKGWEELHAAKQLVCQYESCYKLKGSGRHGGQVSFA